MKKLLNLLSVLIITGTAAPNVIAASSYQKEIISYETKKCDKNENNKYNLIEKWYNNKIKIRINKIVWFKINILLFLFKDKNILIEKLTLLFSKSPTSYNSYKLNEEDIKSFAYLIWENFSSYYNSF